MPESAFSNETSTIVPLDRSIAPVFYATADNYIYTGKALADPEGKNVYLPIDIDTEFTHQKIDLNHSSPDNLSPTVTVQCRAIALPNGTILTHTDFAHLARHPIAESDFAILDYLRLLGLEVEIKRDNRIMTTLPWIQIDLYAFFAVADFLRIVKGEYRNDIIKLCIDGENRGQGIVQGRRLRTFTRVKGEYLNWVAVPWVMVINGREYAVRLAWYDTSAVHGNTSYKQFCQNTGTPVDDKDLFTNEEKADMPRMYVERAADYDRYAVGDLNNHAALINNVELFREIYRSLDLEDYFRIPRLTMGATVRDIIESVIAKNCHSIHPDAKPREIVNSYCQNATASHIKKLTNTTAAFNAKVDGGRCRNNRPIDTLIKGAICDNDIKGCYGLGLQMQVYPLGNPVIIDYPIQSPQNVYLTLRQFIKRYGQDLVPGAWQARVSLPEGYRLKYPQDFLMSWFPPKDISKMPTDTVLGETEEWWTVDNVGLTKIFTHQINLSLVNHDFIQWLDNVATARQRKELYDNLLVVTAVYYPVSERVDTVEALRKAHDKFTGRNTCTIKKVKGKTTKIAVSQECHAWYGATLGDMHITTLLKEREKYEKKTPLNELFKLCINTNFGDMVSPFFTVGNVVVGNNITARARSLAWYMEKGFHGWEAITDGCQFDLNKVLYPGRDRIHGENVVRLYRNEAIAKQHLSLGPLGGADFFEVIYNSKNELSLAIKKEGSTEILDAKAAEKWLNTTTMQHLQALFPNVDVLHAITTDINGNQRIGQFSFEVKGLYDGAVFHGSGNYLFTRNREYIEPKMRSYSKRPQETINSGSLEVSDSNFYPAMKFLTSLFENPNAVERQPVYLKERILKIGDFSRHYANRYQGSKGFPGMTVKMASLLREFSLTQFTYRDIEQFLGWEKESERLRKRYGQSYEMYFINSDGTLNYQLMLQAIDDKISTGMNGFWDGRDKRSEHGYRLQKEHPANQTLNAAKEKLAVYYDYRPVYQIDDETVSWSDTESEEIFEQEYQV
jgi:hypothetical protein